MRLARRARAPGSRPLETAGNGGRSPRGSRARPRPQNLRRGELRLFLRVEELLVLGRAVQRGGRGLARGHDLGDLVEVASADLTLVLDRGEAFLHGGEFLLLQLDEGAHVAARVTVRELEHRV